MINEVSALKYTALHRALCICMAAVAICMSGCTSKGSENDNKVMQADENQSSVTVISRNFIGADISTPEYIEGVKLFNENGNVGIRLKNFGEASIYSYEIDPNYFSIEEQPKAHEIVNKYISDLEERFGVKFNKSEDYEETVYYSDLSTESGIVGLAVCGGDFDDEYGADISVAVELSEENEKATSSQSTSSSDKTSSTAASSAAAADLSGYWKAVYYLADNGNTARTDTYSIFAYNTGSASLYIDFERYEGTWNPKDNGFEFSFGGLHGYGEMSKLKDGVYLLVKFDETDGRIAFENLY